MIEFAPNPSGPAHLGTLRTYAVAWLEARRLDLPLFVRFDAHMWPDRQWTDAFLEQLDVLDMRPDSWQHFTETMIVGSVPDWASIIELPERRMARYPSKSLRRILPDRVSGSWLPGKPMPRMTVTLPPGNEYNAFASQGINDREWTLELGLVKAIHMHLRCTKVIVRGYNVSFIRPYYEEPAPLISVPDPSYCLHAINPVALTIELNDKSR